MGFDAGSITAHLKLDREEFQEGIDQAKQEGRDFEAEEIVVPVKADADEYDETLDKAKEKKDSLEEPVDVPIGADADKFDAEAAEVETAKKELGKSVTIDVDLDATKAEAEAVAARQAIARDTKGIPSIMSAMLGQGLNDEEMRQGLSSLGFSGAEIKSWQASLTSSIASALPEADTAAALASAILPSEEAFQTAMANGIYSLTTGEKTRISDMYSLAGGERGNFSTFASIARDMFGSQAALGEGEPIIARDFLGGQAALGPGPIGDFLGGGGGSTFSGATVGAVAADSFGADAGSEAQEFAKAWRAKATADMQQAEKDLFDQLGSKFDGSPWRVLFKGTDGVASDLRKWAKKAGADVSDDFVKAMSEGITSSAKASAGGGGIFSGLAQSVVGGAGSLTSTVTGGLSGAGGLAALLGPLTVPIAGALGLASAGAVAGTSIGTAGALAALLPGLLEATGVFKAYEAQQAFNASGGGASNFLTLASADSGLSNQQISAAGIITPVVQEAKGDLTSLESQTLPGILSFVQALGTALPAITGFASTGIDSMSRFFSKVDSGLKSSGFQKWLGQMSDDLGPIMDDFGQFFINVGNGFGGFLRLFGGAPAQAVGAWFDRVSKSFSSFMNSAQLGPGFMSGMTTAFNFLGAALDFAWVVLTRVAEAIAPIGIVAMKVLTPAFQGLTQAIEAIPINVLTGLGLALGAWALAGLGPIGLLIFGLLAVGLAIEAIEKAMKPLQGLTFAQLKGATEALYTPTAKRTPTETIDLKLAQSRGLTNSQIVHDFGNLTPKKLPGGGLSSNVDSGLSPDATKKQIEQWKQLQKEAAKAATPPKPTGWQTFLRALGGSFVDLKNWMVNADRTIGQWGGDLDRFFTSSIPNAFNHFVSFWTHGWGDVEGAGNQAWQKLDDNVIHPIAHFFTNDIPDSFNHFRDFWRQAWGDVEGVGNQAWQKLDDNLVHPIVHFFVVDIPDAGNGLVKWFKGLPGSIVSALGNGLTLLKQWGTDIISGLVSAVEGAAKSVGGGIASAFGSIINGIISALNTGINFIDGKIPSVFGHKLFSIPDIPKYEDGGWVGAPPGVPQLALVHGGEYILSRSMLSGASSAAPGPSHSIEIYVDARGATDPGATQRAATSGVNATVPALRRALERSQVPAA